MRKLTFVVAVLSSLGAASLAAPASAAPGAPVGLSAPETVTEVRHGRRHFHRHHHHHRGWHGRRHHHHWRGHRHHRHGGPVRTMRRIIRSM